MRKRSSGGVVFDPSAGPPLLVDVAAKRVSLRVGAGKVSCGGCSGREVWLVSEAAATSQRSGRPP